MTDKQKELLKNAGISESDYENCYITDKNQIFTPLKDGNGILIKTGTQVYNEDFLNPPMPKPTLSEKNRADIDYTMIMLGL